MNDDNVIQFPGAKAQQSVEPADRPAGPHDEDQPVTVDTYDQLQRLGEVTHVMTEAQAKAIQMIMGDHAFVCISMGPDGTGGGAGIRTSVGGNREMIRMVANGSDDGLHGVLSRLLDREDLL